MATIQKHLTSGTECPPLQENKLRLYSMRFCPFVHRVQLVLAAKDIPYEEIYINLSDIPDWYTRKNPSDEVPLLEWIDSNSKEVRFIPESLIICDYLDELHPKNRLHPSDPYVKAKHRVLVGRYGNVLSAFYGMFGDNRAESIVNMNTNLTVYEESLENKFFGGSNPGMIDYMLWPWFERLPVLKDVGYVLNENGKLPKLAAWVQSMQADAAVQKVKVPEDKLKKFIDSFRQGQPVYDIE